MQTKLILTLLAAALASGASAAAVNIAKRGCFSGGEPWGSFRDRAKEHLVTACQNYVDPSKRRVGEPWRQCFNLGDSSKVDFTLEQHSEIDPWDQATCEAEFKKEIDGCDKFGGSDNSFEYTFTADPNAGQC